MDFLFLKRDMLQYPARYLNAKENRNRLIDLYFSQTVLFLNDSGDQPFNGCYYHIINYSGSIRLHLK